jgi:hypothetical protein
VLSLRAIITPAIAFSPPREDIDASRIYFAEAAAACFSAPPITGTFSIQAADS